MLQTFEKLTRMLTQEKRLGYKNKAVMGGFEKLAPNWVREAIGETTSDPIKSLIHEIEQNLLDYPTIAEADRPNYVHKILVKLHNVGETGPQSAPVKEKSHPPSPKQTVERPSSKKPNKNHTPPKKKAASQKTTVPNKPKHQSTQSPPKSTETRSSKQRPRHQATQQKPAPYVSEKAPEYDNTGLDSPVTRLPGIKEAMAKKLKNLSIYVVGDFLNLHPRRYDDYRSLKPINRLRYGEDVTVIGQVWETRKRDLAGHRTLITATVSDGTATINVTWFNQPWLVNQLKTGTQIVISGKVSEYLGRLTFQSPDWEELDKNLVHTGRIVPVYPLTSGITAKWLRQQIKRTVDYWSPRLIDPLPTDMTERLSLPRLGDATRQVHFPDDWDLLESSRRRMAFDELLLIQIAVLRQRQLWQAQQSQPINVAEGAMEKVIKALPFKLTGAQDKVIREIVADIQQNVPMNRLLQGDVGAGKTVVALTAMVLTAEDNGQAAILAPTEILVEQHFQGMSNLLQTIGQALGKTFEIRQLTGSTPAKERHQILEQLAQGNIDILVGTHAIIQEDIEFTNLRLAVVDEQHRFGVEQRAILRRKGNNPHMLVMTATPIPRTLSLTIYGDLDVSVIDELPPGRQVIETRWLSPRERERAYSFIQAQIAKQRQAFIICPLVEESDKLEAKSAIEEHKRLQKEVFPELKLGLLHGRMRPNEKDAVMRDFRDREIDILVSTSVVEVGIDVPNATIMLVEGANRFGLSQLHQFRGRVGRGEHKSYCLLLADKLSDEAQQRLEALERTNNGFELAEEDLKLRGPGEFFGTRQSGLPDMRFVKLSDTRLLETARREAKLILDEDSTLETSKYQQLHKNLNKFWEARSDINQ